MTTKFVVGYDGSAASRRALDFAMERAAAVGATLIDRKSVTSAVARNWPVRKTT